MFYRPSKEEVADLRARFPKGARIVCNYCADPYHPIPSGAQGTVASVDDMGTVHCDFDNGRHFGLVAGEDSFSRVI